MPGPEPYKNYCGTAQVVAHCESIMHIPVIPSEFMPTPQPLSLSIVGLLLVTVLLARRRKWLNRLRGCVLPPGPRGLPVIGNWLDLPRTDQPWIVYDEWAQTYGALYHHVIFPRY